MGVGSDAPVFGDNLYYQNLLERACSHRLVIARCWPVKPKSSPGGFFIGHFDCGYVDGVSTPAHSLRADTGGQLWKHRNGVAKLVPQQ